jgi:putative redox protein
MAETAEMRLQRVAGEKMASTVHVREHRFDVDVNAEAGGDDLGPDPHDLYDAALGACKTLTMMWLARRKGYDVQDISVHISRDASQERQGTYTLTAHVEVKGSLSTDELAALTAAAEKCPVQKLMTQATTVVNTKVQRAS